MLIKIGKILLLNLALLINVNARIPDIKSRIYNPLKNIDDIHFSIKTNQLKELLKTKINQKIQGPLVAKIYKYKDSKELEIPIYSKVPKSINNTLRNLLLLKADIVLGSSLDLWFAGHSFVQEQGGWFTYKDESGILDEMEVKIKFLNKTLNIIQKRPTGTLKASYKFSIKKWSKKLLVLDSIKRELYEGNQSVIINNTIIYKSYGSIGWLPANLKVVTMQRVNSESEKLVERRVEEDFIFTDFKINQDVAKNWFSKFRK